MNSQTTPLRVSADELDTILDALRCLQSWESDDSGGRAEEIEALCERLNLGE